jgi:hypothetical protein
MIDDDERGAVGGMRIGRGNRSTRKKPASMSLPAHFSRAVRHVPNSTYHDRRIGRGGPTAWPPRSTPNLNPLDFYLWKHIKPLCMQFLLTTRRHFIALWTPVRLSATPPASFTDAALHDETCRGVR